MDFLDKRLTRALNKLGVSQITETQKHILSNVSPVLFVCSTSNTDRTLAYISSILDDYLKHNTNDTRLAMILAPTKNSAEHIHQLFIKASKYCPQTLKIINMSRTGESNIELFNKSLLATGSNIIISTPGMFVNHFPEIRIPTNRKITVVIDELNLMMNLEYQQDLLELGTFIRPLDYRCIICSNTLDQQLKEFSTRILSHDPVYIDLRDNQTDTSKLINTNYAIQVNTIEDKYLLIFVLLKLKLLHGRLLIFTNSVSNAYRLHVFLSRFDIRTQVLDPTVPHDPTTIKGLNQGKYNIIITIDGNSGESFKIVDLKRVDSVINFDLPKENHMKRYLYRSSILQNNNTNGTILSFFSNIHSDPSIEEYKELQLQPFNIQMDKVEGFRYRIMDVLKSITRNSIKEAQLRDIKQSLLNSEKLVEHFTNNPKDVDVLRTKNRKRKFIHIIRNIPEYCVTKIKESSSQ